MKIKVLFEGRHDNHYLEDGNGYDIFPLYSSSTLILGKKKILVDTGDISSVDKLLDSLKKEGLTPDEIDFLVLTHFHLDHCSNVYLFKNSEIVTCSAVRFPSGKARILKNFPSGYVAGVEIMKTPGHTLDSISVIAGDAICAGDAVRENHIRNKRIPKYRSGEMYLGSLKKIFNLSKIKKIIPGHGKVIEGDNLNELREIVNNLTLKNVF